MGLITGVPLIGEGHFDVDSRSFLNFKAQVFNLCSILFIRWCRQYSKQMTERIDSQMNLGAFTFLRAIEARTVATFWRTLECSTIDDDRCRFGVSGFFNAREDP